MKVDKKRRIDRGDDLRLRPSRLFVGAPREIACRRRASTESEARQVQATNVASTASQIASLGL